MSTFSQVLLTSIRRKASVSNAPARITQAWDAARHLPKRGSTYVPVACIHSSNQCLRKSKKELSSEPTRFTSSPANVPSMPLVKPKYENANQAIYVSASLAVFFLYFFWLREENDMDEQLNFGLFERVPALEEPHLMSAIPHMKDAGVDTREAEMRLQELRENRLAKETQEGKK